MMNFVRYAAPITCVAALLACNRERTSERERERTRAPVTESTTTITGANVPSVSNDSAVTRIVEARCARELACSEVGPKKHYTSRENCVQKIHTDMKDDLNAKDCPRGIDQKQLDDCLNAIKNESCNNPIDKIERIAACRTGELCVKGAPPNR